MEAKMHVPGAVEILCREIGFRYEPGMETMAMLVAFVRVLVDQVEEMRGWQTAIAGRLGGQVTSVESGNVLARVKTMLDAPDKAAMILSASCAHDYIHEVNPDEKYPTDHLIDMLSSCVSAIGEAEKFQIRSIAAKNIDQAWRRRKMVPACPHCHNGLFPEDFKRIGTMLGRDYALAKLGDTVEVISCNGHNRVDVKNAAGEECYFVLSCGAARLEPVTE